MGANASALKDKFKFSNLLGEESQEVCQEKCTQKCKKKKPQN